MSADEKATRKPDTADRSKVIATLIMALIAGAGLLVILFALGMPKHTTPLESYLGPLAVVVTLAIATNQVIHSLSEVRREEGMTGLSTAITKVVAPFAAVTVAIVATGQPPWWSYCLGLAPFTAPFWAAVMNHRTKCPDHPPEPP